jgi:hypothetical protein
MNGSMSSKFQREVRFQLIGVYRAKTPSGQEKYLPISPNLARFASLREPSFRRFRDPNIQLKISNIFG